jgi:hypothetical protein
MPSPVGSLRPAKEPSTTARPVGQAHRPRLPRAFALATIDAIAERLTDERGLVYRYDTRSGADGLEGKEGTFVLCTFWLAQDLAPDGPARAGTARLRAWPSPTSTASTCWPRKSTRPPVSCSATSPRPSATSDSSTPPGPSPKPNAGRQPPLAADRPCPGSANAAEFRTRPCRPPAWPAGRVRRLHRLAGSDPRAGPGPRLLTGIVFACTATAVIYSRGGADGDLGPCQAAPFPGSVKSWRWRYGCRGRVREPVREHPHDR